MEVLGMNIRATITKYLGIEFKEDMNQTENSKQKLIKIIYDEVKNRCMLPSNIYGTSTFEHHIELVYKIARDNSLVYNANKDIVSLAALLHDIAAITSKDYIEDHHIIGAQIAEELLQEYNLEKEELELIKKCILNHRGSKLSEKTTNEEICVADADAMAHFYGVASLFRMVYVEKNMSVDEGIEFVQKKLERSYNKLSEKGKEIIKPEYEAAKILLMKR